MGPYIHMGIPNFKRDIDFLICVYVSIYIYISTDVCMYVCMYVCMGLHGNIYVGDHGNIHTGLDYFWIFFG